MRPAIVLACALAALAPAAIAAQTGRPLPKSSRLPVSTSAMALGGAYMMDAGHADAVFYHPALLTGASGFGLDLQRWGPQSSASAVSGAVQWLGGGVGVGLQTLQYGAFSSGAAASPPGQDHLFAFGSSPVSERIATVGYARSMPRDIDVGVGVNFIDERVGFSRQSVILVDVGVAREIGPVVAGFTVRDIGQKPILDHSDRPTHVEIGVGGYGQQLGILDIGYSATVGLGDEVTYGAGVELGYWPIQGRTFVARVGFADIPKGSEASPLTTGFAYWGDDITVEWAFRPFKDASEGGSHRIGVRWR
jgi:hypothetical protein